MISKFERNLAISNLCKEILFSNGNIYFVTSLNKNGKAIELELRNDRIMKNLSKQEIEMLFMQRTLQNSLGKEFDESIGSLNYIILQRETMLEFIFPYSEGIMLVVCSSDVIPNLLAKKISFILRDFDWHIQTPINK